MSSVGGRLRTATEFAAVFAQGKAVAGRALVLYWVRREKGPTRVGFCVGKKLGKAVRRNRVRRLLREGWRRLCAKTEIPADLVFIARSGGVLFSLPEWVAAMSALLVKAGLMPGGDCE